MKTKKIVSIIAVSLLTLTAYGQKFDIDLTTKQNVYNDSIGYGYDIVKTSPKENTGLFYYSVKVPDGNYKVTVTLGSNRRAAETVVRAESRRLLLEEIATKKGEFKTFTFIVNKRTPLIGNGKSVKIKEREKDCLHWDNRLTLEFNGKAPAVKNIKIEPDSKTITIFLCGNSTVTDQPNEPYASWGQMIPRWFDDEICISNHAESGLTAGSFIGQNRLDKVLAMMKPGDYVFCEFGHNDEKEKKVKNYGPYGHFTENLKKFITSVRSKGGNILFCTPTTRRRFDKDNKTIINTHGQFPDAIRKLGKDENVPVIDLNVMTTTFLETLGKEDSKKAMVFYPAGTYRDRELADNTHWNPYGAYEISKMVIMGLKKVNSPLTKYLRKDWKDYDPAVPDPIDKWKWYNSAFVNGEKPDGN